MAKNDTLQKNDALTARQRRAIGALLTEPSTEAAAMAAGRSRKTVYRWLALPQFRAALTAAQSEALGVVTARLTGLLDRALDVFAEDLAGEDAGRRSRAAHAIAARYADLARFLDLEGRVALLEAQARAPGAVPASGARAGPP